MKKNAFYQASLFGMLVILILSCKKDQNQIQNPEIFEKQLTLTPDSAKVQFAAILSKAVKNDPDLRTFIKEEALKQFNRDFDVFYPFVKDKVVSEGMTFRSKLLQFMKGEDQLLEIEDALPLLTIYIPKLPSGFSAESWDTKEVPIVSPIINKAKIPVYEDGKLIFSLESDEIPGHPMLVVKNNERVKVNENLKLKSASTLNENSYSFIDEAFDGSLKLKSDPGGETNHLIHFGTGEIKQEHTDALDIMGVSGEYWQRDHIYYGLTLASDTKGALKRNFKETIRSIRFTEAAISKIMDQDDPYLPPAIFIHGDVHTLSNKKQTPQWADGKFEFKFEVLISNTSGLGSTITKYVSIDPDLIFNLEFEYRGQIGIASVYKYKLIKIHTNKIALDIPLVTWDLETNGFSWKFLVSEIDDQQTTTRTEATTTEFATNFEFNPSLNTTAKVGVKFGASAKTSKTSTYSIVTQLNSDDLGTLELNFAEPVLLRKIGTLGLYDAYSIYNSYVEIVVMPKAYY